MSRETSNALAALAILTEGISNVHKTNAQEMSQHLDREQKKREKKEDRKHQLKLQNESFENQKELAHINWTNSIVEKYPGMKFDNNGIPLLDDYDFTKSTSFQQNESETLATTLQERGIYDSNDTFDIMNIKNISYDRGVNFGSNVFGGNISQDISNIMGGDLNTEWLTQNDMDDFERWYRGNLDVDGNLTSFGLMTLTDMGLIPMEVKTTVDQNSGLVVLDPEHIEEGMAYVNSMIEGLKHGVEINKTYKTNEQYQQWYNENANQAIKFSTTIAGSATANKAIQVKKDLSISAASQLGFVQNQDDMKWYMSWGNNTNVKYTKVLKKIDDSGLTPRAKQDLKELLSSLKGVQATGDGIEGTLVILNGLPDDRKLEVLTNLGSMGPPGIQNTLLNIMNQSSKIDQIVDISSKYIQSPIELNKAQGLKDKMQQFGLYQDLQKFRSLQLSTGGSPDPNSTNYNADLENAYNLFTGNLDNLYKMLDDNQKAELEQWLELEESMYGLSKATLKSRGGI
jgi:hypothetical protein